ncbi:hypothetical protein [Oceaniglobus trochenteri]|uniref:hypothetical protein n=1 Tax=Oceaniglobus trochenteri TaxID=2763260 RepID=UPI001CFFE623|nr:hypothetical protein [Oceaniglobus trochenteri]
MIAFTATIDECCTRRITLVAHDRPSAERALRRRLQGRNYKMLDLDVAGAGTGPDARAEVLAHLCSAPFLPLDGHEATVIDWLIAMAKVAGSAEDLAHQNAAMAHAGIRYRPDGIAVATSAVIPFLADVFIGTAWSNGGWGRVISAQPGAIRRNMTFAGQRARAVVLPHAAFPALANRSATDVAVVFRSHRQHAG